MIEKCLTSQTVFSGELLQVRRDEVELANGHHSVREYIVHPGAAVVVPLFPDGRVLLERQFRYPLGRVFLELPAGKRDPGEDLLATAQRELLEETGYQAQEWYFLCHIHPGIGYTNEEMGLYLARDLSLTQPCWDEDETIELVTLSLDDALAKVQSGHITDVKTVIGLFWANRLVRGEWLLPSQDSNASGGG